MSATEGGEGPTEREAVARDFLSYSGALLPTFFFRPPTWKKHIRIPQAYSMLLGMNEWLRSEEFSVRRGKIERKSGWPTRPAFETWLARDFWTFKEDPTETIRGFRDLGRVLANGHFEITVEGLDLLVDHAQRAFRYCVPEIEQLPQASPDDWLGLNSAIFGAIYRGDYGKTWVPLRDHVNDAIRLSRAGVRVIDPIGRHTYNWLVLNVFALFGRMDLIGISGIISDSKLEALIPRPHHVEDAENTLLAARFIETRKGEPQTVAFVTAEFESEVQAFVSGVRSSMAALRVVCRSFAEELNKESSP